jgi:hypothetical protein
MRLELMILLSLKSLTNLNNTNKKNITIKNKWKKIDNVKKIKKKNNLNPSWLTCQICDLIIIPR